MRRQLDNRLAAALATLFIFTTGCSDDTAWAGEADDEAGAEGSTDGDGPLEPSSPDDDGVEPEPEPDDTDLGDDEDGAQPNPDPDDGQLGPAQPVPGPEVDCGNGMIDEGEACDDANADSADGCLSDCTIPTTCLVIKGHDPKAADGPYLVQPPGLEAFEVHCDMTTDGGGYSFLKMDAAQPTNAAEAEAACADWDMQLLIPRTQAHLYASFWVAVNVEIGESASPDYMRMFGIYPEFEGAACDFAPLNSGSAACEWRAGDDGPFWISNRTDIDEPVGHSLADASMAYTFDVGGDLQSYGEIAGGGATSHVFMCDFGDKQ